jgi:hypothetical protein
LTEKRALKRIKRRFFAGTGYIKHWVVVDKGYAQLYPIHINHFDTNGTFKRFYFNESADDTTLVGNAKQKDVDTIMRSFGINDIKLPHDATPFWIYGRDDDGLISGGKFNVSADSAPKAITASYSDAQHKFTWSGLDSKDSLATEFRILIKKEAPPDVSANSPDVAKDWTPGSAAAFNYTPANNLPFSWTYTPTLGPGLYYWRIQSRDRRGTVTDRDVNYSTFSF